ncbi:MAG: peptidase M23 [Cycloclasticus sp. symbiont of Poecilosclerida sp. M]|nr:MAG: peptidase M23 [Cycloclasticus sp. symbiont of Poecilosclerida sp. M]
MFSDRRTQKVVFGLAFAGLFLLPIMLFAEETAVDKARQLASLREKMQVIEKNIEAGEASKSKEEKQLRIIEKNLGATSKKIKGLAKRLKQSNLKVKQLQQKQNGLIIGIEEQKGLLVEQIRTVYALGRQQKVKMLLNQQDPQRMDRIVQYYDYFNLARIGKVKELEGSILKLNAVEQNLTVEQAQFARLIKTKKLENQTLNKAKAQRKAVLATLHAGITQSGSELLSLKEDEKALRQLLTDIKRATDDIPVAAYSREPFSKLRGKLGWPIKGVLQKKFGSIRPSGRWDGVLIGAKEGATIRAVAHGRVVFSDWLRGYGLLLIIDHGEDYLSLYAFNESLYKEVGDWIEDGEAVATVGTSGGQAKAGLYFSIRKNGKPVNPVHWCKAVNKGRVG